MLGAIVRNLKRADPVSNGYTRLVNGVTTQAGPILGSAGPGSNVNALYPVPGGKSGTSGTIQSDCACTFDDLGNNQGLVGVALAGGGTSIYFFHGTAAVPASAELWVNGTKIAQNTIAVGSRRFKLAFEPGRLRAWVDGTLVYDGAAAGSPVCAPYLFVQTDGNIHPHATLAQFSNTTASTSNALQFRRGPSNGSVIANVNNGADQIVSLDALGAGSLDMGNTAFPVKVRYRFFDGPNGNGNKLADLTTPYSYGGDVLGLRAISLVPANAASFTTRRLSSGLLFADDFTSAGLSANWTIESGVWAPAGGALSATVNSGGVTQMRLSGILDRISFHVQMTLKRTSLQLEIMMLLRRQGLAQTFYHFGIGTSNEGTDPNKTRIYRAVAGALTRLAGGTNANPVINTVNRLTFGVEPGFQRGYIDGAAITQSADANAANAPAGNFTLQTFGNGAGGTATIDDVIVCASRYVAAVRVPVGYKLRVNGLDSAASVNGDVSVDLQGTSIPAPQIDIVDGGGTVKKTVVVATYGGDLFVCE